MKHLMSVLFILTAYTSLLSQIYGDGNIQTISKDVPGLSSIEVDFNANITLDYNQEEIMIIDADANVLDYIGITFVDGHLKLDQVKWIEPSKLPTITIGTPNLKTIYQSTHSTTSIKNATGTELYFEGNVGKIIAAGSIDQLYIDTEQTDIDASKLKIGTVSVSGICRAEIKLGQYDKLNKNKDSESVIKVNGAVVDVDANSKVKKKKASKPVKYIKFKIKNNSLTRHSFYVKGPNGRGGKFSYGFSMFPQTSRDENWSIGTKVYKESRTGGLTELITITEDIEGEVVDLFK